jgi:YidC/Oxa1 family membrane protein insertase
LEKRLPLALFLSLLVMVAWQMLRAPVEPLPSEGEVTEPGSIGDPTAATEASPFAGTPAGESGRGETPGSVAAAGEAFIAAEGPETLEVRTGEPGGENGYAHPGEYQMLFSNRGGRLVGLKFLDYFVEVGLSDEERRLEENWLSLIRPVSLGDGRETGSFLLETALESKSLVPGGLSEVLWTMEELDAPEPGVEFVYAPTPDIVFKKRITAVPDSWHLRLQITIENRGMGAGGSFDFLLTPAGCVPAELGDRFYAEPRSVAVGPEDDGFDMDWESAAGADTGGGRLDVGGDRLVFAGSHNKYFAFFLRESDSAQRSMRAARYDPVIESADGVVSEGDYIETRILLRLDLPPEGQSSSWEYTIYAGPKDAGILVEDHEAHQLVFDKDLSTFSTIGKVLLSIMGLFHGLVGNWGVSIILLTVCVRLVLFPLNRRSQTSMARYSKKMKRVQPKLEEIKKKYANDLKKQREAQGKIMQEEGAFPPLGGCLPIFLQIPIFFGLFSALRTSFDLRQAGFAGWIDDLSRPDRLMRLDWDIPFIDLTYLNLLPILMMVLWILQQKGMPQPTDEQAKRMQKMMLFMPIVFSILLYNYAAGLSLYMITQSSLGIVEQRVIKKLWPIDDSELEPKAKKKRGCGPFSGMMQNFAEKQREQMKQVEKMRSAKQSQSRKQRKRR